MSKKSKRPKQFGCTERAIDLYRYIYDFYGRRGYPPSYELMMNAIGGKSKSGVHRLVQQLIERKYIKNIPNRQQSIVPLVPIQKPDCCPHCGLELL